MQKIIGLLVGLVAFVILVVLAGFPHSPPPTQAVVGELIIDQSVSGSSTLGIVTAQKLVDTANSAYFIDPAATGNALVIAGTATISGTIESTTGGFKFPDGSTQTAAAAAIPAGLVSFFNLASCPTGWTELTTARGMYMVGLPLNGTLAGTSGTALTNLESRAVGQHLHSVDPASTGVSITDPGHGHSTLWSYNSGGNRGADGFRNPDDSMPVNSATTGISASVDIAAFNSANAGSVAGTNAPYIQLLACQKS